MPAYASSRGNPERTPTASPQCGRGLLSRVSVAVLCVSVKCRFIMAGKQLLPEQCKHVWLLPCPLPRFIRLDVQQSHLHAVLLYSRRGRWHVDTEQCSKLPLVTMLWSVHTRWLALTFMALHFWDDVTELPDAVHLAEASEIQIKSCHPNMKKSSVHLALSVSMHK